jgi:hypothetical protein
MYYIRLDAENPEALVYYCRHCGDETSFLEGQGVASGGMPAAGEETSQLTCVSKTWVKNAEPSFQYIVNKYTKLDPTLPHTNKMLCPNADCATNKKKGDKEMERDIIYIRYDDVNIKYLYLCSTCDTTWKTAGEAGAL